MASAEEGVIENAPPLSAVAVPNEVVPLNRVTVEPASAVPVIVGVESSVVVDAVVNDVGALGAVVSIVIDKESEAEEILPAASVAFAVNE